MNSIFSHSCPTASGRRALALLLALLFVEAAVLGASFKLEGQSKGSENWISGSLSNWQDLDYVPVRVNVTGSAVWSKTVTISFPHLNRLGPGFERLTNFTTSPNVIITQGPVLSRPTFGDWSYTLTVRYTGNGPGHIDFLARLAIGASMNAGDSLTLKANAGALGELQVHRPLPNDNALLGLRQGIARVLTSPSGGIQVEFASEFNRFYGIQYSRDLKNWKVAQSLALGNGASARWVDSGPPVTESAPETQTMRFYRLFRMPHQLPRCDGGHQHDCGSDDGEDDEDDDDEDDDGDDEDEENDDDCDDNDD